ncbi:proline iminopeptidase [Corynebacterium humireducens NBRC 106098 = DSM 45392]|jgi:pimeloyl-ACP methyl ester carboxylesterase|uniref:Proline iminopeptidase n=2 Tax=Corynebacterium humireducens TaxID=1223514 RepID=A0A0B5DDE3_9CORY|nr:alpha/beta fold hydrolase [Corynebacterium humireducens]AJE33799.1 proline iminopeptidase [Corynebacterium humireducens NBRC 106098 = DSM 45392]
MYSAVTVRDHTLTVPWYEGETIEVFCREISRDDTLPPLLFLQGGPGYPARPSFDGWLSEALTDHRVFLLDQRGTGRSTRIDRHGDPTLLDATHLAHLRASDIVADAEAFRGHLGIERWDVLGQSFGGFCTTTYLSQHPDAIRYAYLTGGLPGFGPAEEVYHATYSKLAARHEQFYRSVPWAEARIREICHHLDNSDERLPTGERLSSRRFRTIGIELGRGAGFENLAMLLDAPFHHVRGEKRLRGDTLADLSGRLSFESAPLYAAIHETIYPGVPAWAAHRVREEVEGFGEDLDPVRAERFHLTGEHIYPWLFEEDPALRDFRGAAEDLAARDWEPQYDAAALGEATAVCAAAVYRDDIFVPRELSLETAAHFRDLRVWETADHQHDGLRADGARILRHLMKMVRS